MRQITLALGILLCTLGSLAAPGAGAQATGNGLGAASAARHQIPLSDAARIVRVANAPAISDGEIAFLYLQANQFEVDTAQLGNTMGSAPQVKDHGQMVVKDHSGVINLFEDILTKSGVKALAPADSALRIEEHRKLMSGLKQKTGADFDRAYLVHEIANHRAVIKIVRETFLPTIKNEQLAAHFRSVLPAFEHHLAMTLDAAKALGVSVEN
jgi:putative membrane protein